MSVRRAGAGGIRTIVVAGALAAGVGAAVVLLGRDGAAPENGVETDAAPAAPLMEVETVRSWPHDATAFTQGLEYADGVLWESTGRYGESSLRRVELETGRVLQRVDLDRRYFGEGLTVMPERVYQVTWQTGVGFVYDRRTLERIGTFSYGGEGWGLANDGTSLILSDGSATLRFLDPETFRVTRTLDVRDGNAFVHDLNELEWVRGEIWANVWHSDRVARIDPQTGRVIAWLDLSALYPVENRLDREAVLNGIAYDAEGDRLFVTGKLWPRLYEIRVPELVGEGSVRDGAG